MSSLSSFCLHDLIQKCWFLSCCHFFDFPVVYVLHFWLKIACLDYHIILKTKTRFCHYLPIFFDWAFIGKWWLQMSRTRQSFHISTFNFYWNLNIWQQLSLRFWMFIKSIFISWFLLYFIISSQRCLWTFEQKARWIQLYTITGCQEWTFLWVRFHFNYVGRLSDGIKLRNRSCALNLFWTIKVLPWPWCLIVCHFQYWDDLLAHC